MNVPRYNSCDAGAERFSEIGLDRFRRVVDHAEKRGVKACFENVEFPHLELKLLLDALKNEGSEALGFTWDVGHEHCYPADFDVSEKFGDLIVGTHFHDNFGQKDNKVVTWDDDLHLLPFDGNIDYKRIAQRLKTLDFKGSVTLEIDRVKGYEDLSLEEYLAVAHERAVCIVQ